MWVFSEKKRGFGLRKEEERGKGERDIERDVAAMVHLLPLVHFYHLEKEVTAVWREISRLGIEGI